MDYDDFFYIIFNVLPPKNEKSRQMAHYKQITKYVCWESVIQSLNIGAKSHWNAKQYTRIISAASSASSEIDGSLRASAPQEMLDKNRNINSSIQFLSQGHRHHTLKLCHWVEQKPLKISLGKDLMNLYIWNM